VDNLTSHSFMKAIQRHVITRLHVGPDRPEPVLTTDEAARYLDLHPDTLRKLVRGGAIAPLRNFRRPQRFLRSELDRYLYEKSK